jgi:hypothetical protein
MDLAKFISMMMTQSLRFVRLDHLGDPFEGYPPVSQFGLTEANWEAVRDFLASGFETVEEFIQRLQSLPEAKRGTAIVEFQERGSDGIRRAAMNLRQIRTLTKDYFVNCWHVNENESEAMWKLYLQGDQGIVLRSSVQRLINSLAGYAPHVHIGKVKYVDHFTSEVAVNNFFEFALLKRRSLEHERELRAVIWGRPLRFQNTITDCDVGINAACCLDTLIEEIRVAPTAKDWFLEIVRSVSQAYRFGFSVQPSYLARPPIW